MAGADEIHYGLVAQYLNEFPPKLQSQLVEQAGSYTALFTESPESLEPQFQEIVRRLQQEYHRQRWSDQIDSIMVLVERVGAQIIPITSLDYPQQLKQISSAPPLLYTLGQTDNLHLPQIAIVGSRRMTRGGENNALQWSRFLANSGFTITSGLALGVDGCAHRGALEATNGKTVAVMATGIDSIYPQRHRQLAEQILDSGGTLVTEFHPNEKPLPTHFPRRNRIISGLSLGVLVVEAAVKSGSLITARYALEQNREVFAIPGSIHNPQSRGCHLLIKEGAQLVESGDDIISELGGALAAVAATANEVDSLGCNTGSAAHPAELIIEHSALNEQESALLKILGFEPMDIDSLSREHSMPVETLSELLIGLELKGIIGNENGFYQRLV
ncbi:DNA-processing protein DprA [Porticoccaceae bacterium]|jgi:DNA processing protein|nr:DNA-processing protein DprA [Porticoccaceae bacterium]MDB4308473.1 DNA-processing protein DprA [Porticoccaceae bacterium]MDB9952981.1 DNA-processing protein DprA [Porticoccaceae bacterium]MDC0004291.1 DNA-processing protein DprA [Porticoccaceae bacterium]